MAPYIARAILSIIFAFILFDTIREFNRLFALSINPYWTIIPAVFVYGFQEFMIKKWKAEESVVPTGKTKVSIIRKILSVSVWITVVSIFFGIIIVWSGVIYKAIIRG
jgi:hypothetical protein